MLKSTQKRLIISLTLITTMILLGIYIYSDSDKNTSNISHYSFKGYFSLNKMIINAWKEYAEKEMDKPDGENTEVVTTEEQSSDETEELGKSEENINDSDKEELPIEIPVKPNNGSNIVGYYAGWSAHSGYTPDKIDANKLTHINYAFANIGPDLKIMLGDSSIDSSNFKKLNALKNTNKNLKILISVGGWTWSDKFSDVALTESSRVTFADSVVEFLVKYGIDGVDIDWEYPVAGGLSKNTKRATDKENFTLLLKTLRDKLDNQSAKDGKYYYLTFSGGTSKQYVDNVELKKLSQYVDFANIMTYDIHGDWDKFTDFNAPLYNFGSSSPHHKWSVDSAINLWIKAGFPANKINMGLPFYGYRYDNIQNANNGFLQSFIGAKSITYKEIVTLINTNSFTRHFHSEAKVPWIYDGSTFISYDDEESIAIKTQYINSKGLGGAMIWELSHDPSGELLNTIFSNMR